MIEEGMTMNNFGKFLLTLFAFIYVVSPVDLCPGPLDDIIVMLLTYAAKKGSGKLVKRD